MIVDLSPQNKKDELLNKALEIGKNFCEINNLPNIANFIVDNNLKSFGLFENKKSKISINVKKCKPPTKTPGFCWSYPGYKADLTPYGVLLHEYGHHIHSLNVKIIKDLFERKTKFENFVTSYEPNVFESIAEAFKLYLGNPDLLEQGRPARFNIFFKELKLKPVIDLSWKDVLKNAHPRFFDSAEKWIKNGKR
jgi:hypothetical protein